MKHCVLSKFTYGNCLCQIDWKSYWNIDPLFGIINLELIRIIYPAKSNNPNIIPAANTVIIASPFQNQTSPNAPITNISDTGYNYQTKKQLITLTSRKSKVGQRDVILIHSGLRKFSFYSLESHGVLCYFSSLIAQYHKAGHLYILL